jgi:hypothetical protein
MSDLRTAAQQALEVLEAGPDVDPIFAGETEVALRAALEQPEQEPLFVVEGGKLRPLRPALLNDGDKLYTHPPRRAWQFLSAEERYRIADESASTIVAVLATEAALRSKNHG